MASNGGSLEDCFSNVFALTELNGLKWRCFLTPQNAPRGVPIPSDPVLKAYGRCLQDGLICTWRRKPLQIPTEGPEPLPLPSFTNDISKELWLFWYSSEPPEGISEYTSHLEGDESGVGSALNGISYEVRVLFFKALHTGIERSVSKAGFVRFGRWFTRPLRQPLSGRQHLLSHYVLAFNMQFFIHGGNTVCMTLNAQRQPPLLRLAKRHLDCGRRVQVVVGPWSLRAVLLPGDTDAGRNQASADRQWEEWKEFVALGHDPEDLDDESREEGVPRMVTLELDGIRMLYPSCYVCVTMEDDAASCPKESQSAPVPSMTPDELITSDNGRRNRLLVSNVNGQMYMQGVLQNAHLSRRNITTIPAAPQNGPFQAPYPPQSDDETKYGGILRTLVVRIHVHVMNVNFNQVLSTGVGAKLNNFLMHYYIVNSDSISYFRFFGKAKSGRYSYVVYANTVPVVESFISRYSYHRRHCLSSTADSASLPRLSSPEEDTVDTEHDTSDDDIIHPAWADASKESLVTGIYCSADDARYTHCLPVFSQYLTTNTYTMIITIYCTYSYFWVILGCLFRLCHRVVIALGLVHLRIKSQKLFSMKFFTLESVSISCNFSIIPKYYIIYLLLI
uniref:Mediator of RNA polymerase II transcription subunit 13 n=1 Tax=Heterorhabditis bacteriophora TaxID=37862 RepID=A0A1I7X145_HETBA